MVTWSGDVSINDPVTITFDAQVDSGLTSPTYIPNLAIIDDGINDPFIRRAVTVILGFGMLLPGLYR